MADIEYLKKIDARIAELVAAKNAELNSESLEADLALESNVREVSRLAFVQVHHAKLFAQHRLLFVFALAML